MVKEVTPHLTKLLKWKAQTLEKISKLHGELEQASDHIERVVTRINAEFFGKLQSSNLINFGGLADSIESGSIPARDDGSNQSWSAGSYALHTINSLTRYIISSYQEGKPITSGRLEEVVLEDLRRLRADHTPRAPDKTIAKKVIKDLNEIFKYEAGVELTDLLAVKKKGKGED